MLRYNTTKTEEGLLLILQQLKKSITGISPENRVMETHTHTHTRGHTPVKPRICSHPGSCSVMLLPSCTWNAWCVCACGGRERDCHIHTSKINEL